MCVYHGSRRVCVYVCVCVVCGVCVCVCIKELWAFLDLCTMELGGNVCVCEREAMYDST